MGRQGQCLVCRKTKDKPNTEVYYKTIQISSACAAAKKNLNLGEISMSIFNNKFFALLPMMRQKAENAKKISVLTVKCFEALNIPFKFLFRQNTKNLKKEERKTNFILVQHMCLFPHIPTAVLFSLRKQM